MRGASVALNRRSLLQATLVALLPGAVRASASDEVAPVFLSAATLSDDEHCLRAFTVAGEQVQTLFNHRLPGRAHHIAVHAESRRYVVAARRPGTWLAAGSLDSQDAPDIVSLPHDRRACGHGFFSADGSRFWSVETTLEDHVNDGLLVGWQSANGSLQRDNELSTAGTGPHEALMLADDRTVVIANGGYRTAGDDDRTILNPDTMRPSLVYLDSLTGDILQQVENDPAMHMNSIRHLDVNARGQVVIAMQFEGEPFIDVPLVGMHIPGDRQIHYPQIPLHEQQQLNQYCGSARFDESGRYAVVSAPRGNRMTFWDMEEGRFLQSVRSRDGCGVAAWKTGFIFTAGTGKVTWYDCETQQSKTMINDTSSRLYWDNHLSRV